MAGMLVQCVGCGKAGRLELPEGVTEVRALEADCPFGCDGLAMAPGPENDRRARERRASLLDAAKKELGA